MADRRLGAAGIAGLVLAGSWQPGSAVVVLVGCVVAGLWAGQRATLTGLAALVHAAF